MPSLKAIRNRIRSVKNTQQITRAMKMVAAARLRRAQEAVTSARPYSVHMREVLQHLVRREHLVHPLLQSRPMKKVELMVLTSDRGLCGGFNANVMRAVQRFLIENEGVETVTLQTIGRKGYEFFRRRSTPIRKDHPGMLARLAPGASEDLARELTHLYVQGEADAIFLVYNEFVSAVTQRVKMLKLLPIDPEGGELEQPGREEIEYLFEPNRAQVLEGLLPRYVANQVWQAMLESLAAENAARMTAMDSATNNAADMIGRLTLQYNRTRQAAITKELMEIVSGAEALK